MALLLGNQSALMSAGRVSKNLEKNTWDVIAGIAQRGQGANYWSIGDCKSVVISGTVGIYTFSSETYYCYIIGFNHNPDFETSKSIHFNFALDSTGKNLAFTDSGYYNYPGQGYCMYQTQTTRGGWESSYLRNTICEQFFNALPSDLQAVICACTKWSDNVSGGTNLESNMTATSDKIFIPSEYEVSGVVSVGNSYQGNYNTEYQYWANGNTTQKYRSTSTSSRSMWWLRSYSYGTNGICVIDDGNGNPHGGDWANDSVGFAPCFMVA